MADIRQLQKVLDLRREVEEQALEELAKARSQVNQLQLQVGQVEDYRRDYLVQLQNNSNGGMTASQYQHLQAFICRLDDTQQRLNQAVFQARQLSVQQQQKWQKANADAEAVAVLIEKEQRLLEQRQQKMEQNQLDEFATRQYFDRLRQA